MFRDTIIVYPGSDVLWKCISISIDASEIYPASTAGQAGPQAFLLAETFEIAAMNVGRPEIG